MLIDVLITTRPSQWTKNFVVFIPLIFSFNEFWDLSSFTRVAQLLIDASICFLTFILASASTYLLNDVLDAKKDRLHPDKKNRPLAKESISPVIALFACSVFLLCSITVAIFFSKGILLYIVAYFFLMTLYSFLLRDIFVIDVLCISSGFVIRVMAGAIAVDVPISLWLYVCMGFGALFISLAKRLSEAISAPDSIETRRKTMHYYGIKFLGLAMTAVLLISLISYCLYIFTANNLPANNSMILTIPFVAFGLFRYQSLVRSKGFGERPELIFFEDKILLANVFLWMFVVFGVLYAFR